MWAKFHDGGFHTQLDNNVNDYHDLVNEFTDYGNFVTYEDFHRSVGHVRMNRNTAQRLYADGDTVPIEPPNWHCHDCVVSKSVSYQPKSIVDDRAENPFDVIYTDLSGKFSTPSLSITSTSHRSQP